LAVVGELDALVVVPAGLGIAAVAANPDIVVGIDGDAVFLHRPVELLALVLAHGEDATPALDEAAIRAELHDRGRWHAPPRLRRAVHRVAHAGRAGIDPDIVVRIHRHAAAAAEKIAVGHLLGPARVHL